MNEKSSKFSALLATIAMIICSSLVLNGYFATTVGRVVLNGKFPVNATVDVSITNIFGRVVTERVEFSAPDENTHVRVGTTIINASLDQMSLTFSAQPKNGIIHLFNIYGISINQPLATDVEISQSRLSAFFSSENFFSDSSNVLRANSVTGKASLILARPISSISRLWLFSVSLFLGLLTWLLVRYSWISNIPAFRDMQLGRNISSKHEFDAVNGLRGIAALLVLLSHSAPGFFAINMGIAILFVISGFLLSRPFVEDANRIYSWTKVELFLAKRVKRILPMYYFFIVITYVTTSQFDTALRNFLFIEASGHLWPMTQIFTFYLCLPLLLLVTSALFRVNNALPVIALIAAAAIWEVFMSNWKPFYNGRFPNQFHLFAFLIGVAGSYVNYGQLNANKTWRLFVDRWSQPLSVLLLAILVLTIAWSAPVRPPVLVQLFISQFYVKCVLALLIIILSLQLSSAFITRLMANWLFRSVGVIGFSFYLLHGLGIELALNLQSNVFGVLDPSDRSWTLMLTAFCITYVMAVFTYSYIERPFFGSSSVSAATNDKKQAE